MILWLRQILKIGSLNRSGAPQQGVVGRHVPGCHPHAGGEREVMRRHARAHGSFGQLSSDPRRKQHCGVQVARGSEVREVEGQEETSQARRGRELEAFVVDAYP